MFCCLQPPKTSNIPPENNEKKSLLRSSATTINYQTIITIPYAHVIRDDKIPIESSNFIEVNASDTYLLFNGVIPDETYETACFSFDDVNVSTPVVIATKAKDVHFLFERIYPINQVGAINPSTSIRMHPMGRNKSMTSTTVSMARPFDEFLISSTESTLEGDVKSNSITTKSSKN